MDAKVCDVCNRIIEGDVFGGVTVKETADFFNVILEPKQKIEMCEKCYRSKVAASAHDVWDKYKQQRKHDKARNTKAD